MLICADVQASIRFYADVMGSRCSGFATVRNGAARRWPLYPVRVLCSLTPYTSLTPMRCVPPQSTHATGFPLALPG